MNAVARNIVLIGAPTDVGAGIPGARLGPEALRLARIARRLADCGHAVRDAGDIAGPRNPEVASRHGYRHLEEVVRWNELVHVAVRDALAKDEVPVVMGGDHCLGFGSVSAVAQHCRSAGRRLRVLWLDAHSDLNTAATTPTGNLHGMPVACLCGHGPSQLLAVAQAVPAVSPDAIRQLGIRSVDPGEQRFIRELGLEVYDMRRVDELGMRETMARALDGVNEGVHLHVSFDVDYLDPQIAPGVGTTIAGGPGLREAQLCMEMIADTGCLGSLDIVELNPLLDDRNRTAHVAVELVESMFGKSTLLRS